MAQTGSRTKRRSSSDRHVALHIGTALMVLLAVVFAAMALVYKSQLSYLLTRLMPAKPLEHTVAMAPAEQTDPYAGWQAYTIPKSNLGFEYPPSWQIDPTIGPLGPWASPGTPETSLVAPNGLYMDILTDNDNRVSESGNTVLYAQPVQSLGSIYFLDYIDAVGDHKVTYVALLAGPASSSPYPSVMIANGLTNRLVVSIAYKTKSGAAETTLNTFRTDPTMQQAVLVIESLRVKG